MHTGIAVRISQATALLLLCVAFGGCKSETPTRAKVRKTNTGKSGVEAAKTACKPKTLALAEFPGVVASKNIPGKGGLFSLSGSAFSATEGKSVELKSPAQTVHYLLRGEANLNGAGAKGLELFLSGKDSATGTWSAETLIELNTEPHTHTSLNVFTNGQLHGFFRFPNNVSAVKIRAAAGSLTKFLREIEIASEAPPAEQFGLAGSDSAYLPPKYVNKPIGFSIVPREEWKAMKVNESEFERTKAQWVVAHHSADHLASPSECQSHVQSYQRSHITSKGWTDIAYHFLICPDGRVFEGRASGKGVQGAHAHYANRETVSINFIGNYESTNSVSSELIETGAKVTAWLAFENGIDLANANSAPIGMRPGEKIKKLTFHNYLAQRNETASYSTDCAGKKIIDKLDVIRTRAMELIKQYGSDSLAASSSSSSNSEIPVPEPEGPTPTCEEG
jgi:hypothetical protein